MCVNFAKVQSQGTSNGNFMCLRMDGLQFYQRPQIDEYLLKLHPKISAQSSMLCFGQIFQSCQISAQNIQMSKRIEKEHKPPQPLLTHIQYTKYTEQSIIKSPTSFPPIPLTDSKPSQQFSQKQSSYFQNINNSLVGKRRVRSRHKNKSRDTLIQLAEINIPDKQRTEKCNFSKTIATTENVKLFQQKLTFNSIRRTPVDYNPFNKDTLSIPKQLPNALLNALLVAKIIFIILYIFTAPLAILFQQLAKSTELLTLKCITLVLVLFDLLQQSVTNYHKHSSVKHIIISIFLILFTLATIVLHKEASAPYLYLAFCVLIPSYIAHITKLELQIFLISHYSKYWDLFKVFMSNLAVCHLLASVLLLISKINPQTNWMSAQQLEQLPWFQQYIWSYYFGTTIVLTIGFGDFHATNYHEALFLIIISFFSCIFFGYNINYLGHLINTIHQQENEKEQKLKTLNTLAQRANVPPHIHAEISQFIAQEAKIKQQTNHHQQKLLLQELPQSLRSSFLQQSNQKLFNHLKQMIPLTNKTIQRLSLAIQAKICHPQQFVKRIDDGPSMMILQSGQVGFTTRRKYSDFNNIVVHTITNQTTNQSKLICLDLIALNRLNYEIKSLDYSVIYSIDKSAFEDCLRPLQSDYQIYRQILDKHRYKPDQYSITKCSHCPYKHTPFECPKLHYQPFKNYLPYKHFKKYQPEDKQHRVPYLRQKNITLYDQAINIDKNIPFSKQYLSFDSLKSLPPNNPHNSFKANSGKRLPGSARESILLTMQMVTQIREEIQNLKQKVDQPNFTFTLWDIECDQASNFQNYFPQFNSNTKSPTLTRTLLRCTGTNRKKIKKMTVN